MADFIWPDGARCAVMLTCDFDSESLWFSEDATAHRKPSILSQGTYGPKRGVYKMLDVFRDFEVPASFYVPGWTAEQHTAAIEAILKNGHEVGHHGHMHKWIDPANYEEEVEEMDKGLEALKRTVGVVPKGYRAPAGTSSDRTLELVRDRGFLYNSGFLDDYVPYRHTLADGSEGPIELPFHWQLDDSALSLYIIQEQSTILTNDHIFQVWKEEFDALYEWGGLANYTLHPQISGRPARNMLLRRIVEYMRSKEDVWFATGTEVAEAFAAGTARPAA
ncbi:ribulose-phosphate 3-epimerase [Leisingera sp. ANG-M1]|uniref:polysaccharide deacetylase family protein n=1 Tax=Leisingera sp. ANG-M1 TaxID=1577895 RepID=UPI00057E6B1B|nr:polysaccharide deacetylase [Leisingera sp. ANG-M1]KIC09075.1 ribulose-phosphate 3-epimerase [Leisingera sp. ANG-M1]